MNVFRFRTNSGCRWPRFPPNQAVLLWAAYDQLERSQWLSVEEIERGQIQQLRFLWRHCLEDCEYYRSIACRPEDLQTLEDLHKLPLLSREALQQNAQLAR